VGLDWHSVTILGKVKCGTVGAQKFKDFPDLLHDYCIKILDRNKKLALKYSKEDNYRIYWESMTLENLIEQTKDNYLCNRCGLLKSLDGADQMDSLFIGYTCKPCDFRGQEVYDVLIGLKQYGLADECYLEHDSLQMLNFANRLEKLKQEHENLGTFTKKPYDKYINEFKQILEKYVKEEYDKSDKTKDFNEYSKYLKSLVVASLALTGPEAPMSQELYDSYCEWCERTLIEAVRWLRVTSRFGLCMKTSY